VIWLAQQIAAAGADCLSSGIGWHEAQIPTIAGIVPHAAFVEATARLKKAVTIPVTASNRINLPEVAERILSSNSADLISMARPLLADPALVRKLSQGRADLINVCIACNQQAPAKKPFAPEGINPRMMADMTDAARSDFQLRICRVRYATYRNR
jgi:2,4-dienoyl-CoA reductase (NADPH2)